MGYNGSAGRRMRAKARGDLVAVLDVGTTKVVCLIGRIDTSGRPRVIGIGHQVSYGVRAGSIVDMESAEQAIGQAVHAAERMAGQTIRDLLVNLSAGHPTSQTIAVEVEIAGHEVTAGDLRRALRSCHDTDLGPDIEVVHAIPVSYSLDGTRGIRDPRGMFGEQLDIDLHLVTASATAMRNLTTCIGRCHLEVAGFVASPYAAAMSCLVPDETELGCTLIDLGGGTTGLAVFLGGKLVFTDCLPVGGLHVTNDVAHCMTTSVACAERMKTLYGNAMPNLSDEHEIIEVPQIGEGEHVHLAHLPRSALASVIQPRLEEILELVRGRLETTGFFKETGRRVVLTGGGSQLQGVRELAQLVLDKQVRLGRPTDIAGLSDAVGGPAFATAAGLLTYAAQSTGDLALAGEAEASPMTGLWGRIEGWLRSYL